MRAMTSLERWRAACRCDEVDRPPVWLMRQAGRSLPEYRRLRKKHSFVELVRMPELAVEATLQPVRRFGFDAAILFSDILVVPEALGQAYFFREGEGIRLAFRLRGPRDLARLEPDAVTERLAYEAETLSILRDALPETALLGFGGSPWTLANYMVEGGSAAEFRRLKEWFHADRASYDRLMTILSRALVDYFRLQIRAGVDAIQIFDSFAGLLAPEDYEAASGRWIARIVRALGGKVPVIVFARGAHANWKELVATGADVLSVDWTYSMRASARAVPRRVALQGNLDPALLTTTPRVVARRTASLLDDMRGRKGFIVNLGHGTPPDAKLDCIEALVETVRSHRWPRGRKS